MRFTPSLMVGATASAALAASVLLMAEDRALFEPQHATEVLAVVDQVGAAWSPPAAIDTRARSTPADLRLVDRHPAAGRR